MQTPSIPLELTMEQADLLYRIIQADIVSTQKVMRSRTSDCREGLRHRILRLQEIRRQIPDCAIRTETPDVHQPGETQRQ